MKTRDEEMKYIQSLACKMASIPSDSTYHGNYSHPDILLKT